MRSKPDRRIDLAVDVDPSVQHRLALVTVRDIIDQPERFANGEKLGVRPPTARQVVVDPIAVVANDEHLVNSRVGLEDVFPDPIQFRIRLVLLA